MKIAIDGRMLGWTGIGRYTRRLLEHFEQLGADHEIVVVMLEKDRALWSSDLPNFKTVFIDANPYSWREQTRLPRLLKALQVDLVHFPHFAVPILFNDPYVVTIQDLTLVDFKNVRSGVRGFLVYELRYWASRLSLGHAIRASRHILTSTQYVKDQLASRFGVSEAQVTVASLAADTLKAVEPAINENLGQYIFYLGTSFPYKNLDQLVDEYLASSFHLSGGKLVLAGPEDYFRAKLRERVADESPNSSIIFMGRVTDSQLATLFLNSVAFVFPSLSEGFGLPGLEAMSYGAPVIAAKASCFPEVYGRAVEYFQPSQTGSLAAAIDNLYTDDERRRELIELGAERVSLYSWRQTALKTLAAYQQASGS